MKLCKEYTIKQLSDLNDKRLELRKQIEEAHDTDNILVDQMLAIPPIYEIGDIVTVAFEVVEYNKKSRNYKLVKKMAENNKFGGFQFETEIDININENEIGGLVKNEE